MIRKKKRSKYFMDIRNFFPNKTKRRKRLLQIERYRRYKRKLAIPIYKNDITPTVVSKPVFNITYEPRYIVDPINNTKEPIIK